MLNDWWWGVVRCDRLEVCKRASLQSEVTASISMRCVLASFRYSLRPLAMHSSIGIYAYTGWPKKFTLFLYALTSSNINRFSRLFHHQNKEKICNNTITKDPTVPQVFRYTTLWNVKCFIDRAIRQWRRQFECIVQQQGGHIEHLMWKLQDVTVTLDNNWDNKHVVSCCQFLKICCYRSHLVFSVAFKTFDISQGIAATRLRCDGIFSDSIITNLVLILTVK